jgi:acetaldehyde dehydrogenase (acetylating)
MSELDSDLLSIQEVRRLLDQAAAAQQKFSTFTQDKVDAIVAEMAAAGEASAEVLAKVAHEETGFGRIESKTQKNLFATRTLHDRMMGMRTAGIIRKLENDTIWEIAVPMGVVAALIPSTNPTSTAMYKAIIGAKARCGVVMSPHPRAVHSTGRALEIVAEAAYSAGAPPGLFGCMSVVTLAGTNELLEHPITNVILATGGTPMVKAAYSKGKPALGVGSGNVPVYVDRSADVEKAAADLVYGASFDWGTLCSTERSVVADVPIRGKLIEAMKSRGACFLDADKRERLRRAVWKEGRLNVDQVGQSPARIASLAGFSVPKNTRVLVAEVDSVGPDEPLSMETLSPILSFYTSDGWEAGCERCIEVLAFGGLGHTLGLHCTSERVIEAFALKKPAMRIVVNTVAALGSVGYTNRLFPSMTLGPGALGGSITSDNISPLHLVNVKRLAMETSPINHGDPARPPAPERTHGSWIDEIEDRLVQRAGSPALAPPEAPETDQANLRERRSRPAGGGRSETAEASLSEEQIEAIIARFRKN